MSSSYQYSLTTDFTTSQDIQIPRFIDDLKANPSLADKPTKINIDGDIVTIAFESALSAGEKSDLDTIVADHLVADLVFESEATIRDVKSPSTDGGTFDSGSWITRDLNTVTGGNVDLWIKLSGNAFTLKEGRYALTGLSASNNVGNNQTRIFNITTDTPEFYSVNSNSGITSIRGNIVVSDTSSYRLEHMCQTTQTDTGFGVCNKFGETEIYSEIYIRKTF